MKRIVKNVPETFIRFDNGAEKKGADVLKMVGAMEDAGWTEFDLKDPADAALLELVRNECRSAIQEETAMSGNVTRVTWNYNNGAEIDALYKKFADLVYGG